MNLTGKKITYSYLFTNNKFLLKYDRLLSNRFLNKMDDMKAGDFVFAFNRAARHMKTMKTKLLIGSTPEDKKEWVRIQYFEMKKSISEIADELDEDILTVQDYVNELRKLEQ